MTFVLALGNSDQIVQVSDRQLTDSNGGSCVLPENKAAILTLADSRLLVGFAGLAKAGRFRTGQWILEALGAAATDDHLALGTVQRFTEAATKRFLADDLRRVPRPNRGLSLLFTGYNDTRPFPNLIAALVSNFQNFESGADEEPWDQFKANYWSMRSSVSAEDATYIQRVGAWRAMDDADEKDLRDKLEAHRPNQAITEAAVGKVRAFASRKAAGGTIGRDLSAAVLPAVRAEPNQHGALSIQIGFHPEGASNVLHGVSQVISQPGLEMLLMDPQIRAEDPSGAPTPMAVQKVGRNKPCPCGSGKKYKLCHGR